MKKNQMGSLFEADVEKALQTLAQQELLFWHRLADRGATKGGLSAVGSQPSDYIVGYAGAAYLLEAKSSYTHDKMSKELMQGSQRNAINRWSMANDLPYYIIFWAINRGVVELWDGRAILKSSRGLDQKGLLQTEIVSNSTAHMSVDHDALVRMLSDTFKVSAKLCFKRLILNRKKWGVE